MVTLKVTITTPFIKLDQLLKFADITGSGGEASFLISQGFVSVDGTPETQRGKKIKSGMTVTCSVPDHDDYLIIVQSQEDC